MVSYMQVHPSQGMTNTFIEGKGSWEGYKKQRVHGFSLAESLPGKESFLQMLGLAIAAEHESAPSWFPNSI